MTIGKDWWGIYLLTIKSGGQAGQPDAAGTIIFQGNIVVVENTIVKIYESNFPQTDLLLPMDDRVYNEADNIYPINDDGVNFISQSLLNGLFDNLQLISSFNLYYGNDLLRLYQAGTGDILIDSYQITID